MNPLPEVELKEIDDLCELDDPVQLIGTPTGGIFTGNVSSTGLFSPKVSGSGSFKIFYTYTDSNGCINSDSITINVYEKAIVGNFTWEDLNGDGCQDIGEPGINGVQVQLYDALTNTSIASTISANHPQTNTPGWYQFEVCPGEYYIQFGKPAGFERSPKNAICTGGIANDSDADPTSGNTDAFTLNEGETNMDIDAGFFKISIGVFKKIKEVVAKPDGTFDVVYEIKVVNNSGVAEYDLWDVPGFDDDIVINSASFSSDMPSGGALTLSNGKWILATDQEIDATTTHTFTLTVNVSLDLTLGVGDNMYEKCGGSTSIPQVGEGLYNIVYLDINKDGEPDDSDDACGDLPFVTHDKEIVGITQMGDHMYDVVYSIVVKNSGGAAGVYSLSDVPGFDNDISITGALYTSDAPNNIGGVLTVNGPWTLATNQTIGASTEHTYTLTVSVKIDLKDETGDNVYSKCGSTQNQWSPGQGLYNKSRLDRGSNGTIDEEDDACGDIPYIIHEKVFQSAVDNGNGTYTAKYKIEVRNIGGAEGTYGLKDSPAFDNDALIISAGYRLNNGALVGLGGAGPWILVTGKNLLAEATDVYDLEIVLSINLNDGIGDNVYTPCGSTTGTPKSGEGLFNRSELDRTGNGVPDEESEACGDIFIIRHNKTFESATQIGLNTYKVIYKIVVQNLSNESGQYALTDQPLFDNDVKILAASYTSNATGNAGQNLSLATPWILANNQSIVANSIHTYFLNVDVQLDLSTQSQGDRIYSSCASGNGIPGPGKGLYNRSFLYKELSSPPIEMDEACGDLPFITHNKSITLIQQTGARSYVVVYQIEVENKGGATGNYTLNDQPLFDDDITITSAAYTSNVNGLGGNLNINNMPWALSSNQSIGAGVKHTYTMTISVNIDLSPGSSGNNIYSACGSTNGSAQPGQGLYNRSTLDTNNDGIPDETSFACGDLPFVTHEKLLTSITPIASNQYRVVYTINVRNLGGATGQYRLQDHPYFDDDITINAASFTTNILGYPGGTLNPAGPFPWNLTNNRSINSGSIHTYVLQVDVTLDLSQGSSGNNIYSACGSNVSGLPIINEGLFNRSLLDVNNDGTSDEIREVCGDLPSISHRKTFVSVVQTGPGLYTVKYKIEVTNGGGVAGNYRLIDQPLFDDDISILSASYVSNAPGNPGGVLNGNGTWQMANNQTIGAGITHTFDLTVNIKLDLSPGSSGDNKYSPCGSSSTQTPKPGEGLFNRSRLDINSNGVFDETREVCGDIPLIYDLALRKSLVSSGPFKPNDLVTYTIQVINEGQLNANAIVVEDRPQAGLTYHSSSLPAGVTYLGAFNGNNRFSVAGPAINSQISFNLTYRIAPDFKGFSLTNVAEIYQDDGDDIDSTPNNNVPQEDDQDQVTITIEQTASISLEKLTNGKDADIMDDAVIVLVPDSPISTITWTYVVKNTGTLDLKDVKVTDDKEGFIGNISLLKVGETQMLIKTAPAMRGMYSNVGTVEGQPIDAQSNPIGSKVSDTDPSNYIGIYINVEKQADKLEICPGETVNYTLITRMLGGGPGLQLRNINVKDNNLSEDLMPGGMYWAGGDTNNNGFLDFGEEFMWKYSLVLTEDNTNMAEDIAEVFFNGVSQNLFPMGMDEVTVTMNSELCSCIGDFVWDDINANGIQNSGEPGISNVTVKLFTENGTLFKTTKTNTQGLYEFCGIPQGNYYVKIENYPDVYYPTLPLVGNNKAIDSDLTGANGANTTNTFPVQRGVNDYTIDFGLVACIEISGMVWYDINFNDIKDWNENGINGLEVRLFRKNNNNTWSLYSKMRTKGRPGTQSDDGYYGFCVPFGEYYVQVVPPPSGLKLAKANATSDWKKDSDITGINGPMTTNTLVVNHLSNKEFLKFIDAGFAPSSMLASTTWVDENSNGIIDNGEPPLKGVKVQVFNFLDQWVAETMSDDEGYFEFENLDEGEYYLKFTAPNGYTYTQSKWGKEPNHSNISAVNHENGSGTSPWFSIESGELVTDLHAGFIKSGNNPKWTGIKVSHHGSYNLLEWTTEELLRQGMFKINRWSPQDDHFAEIAFVAIAQSEKGVNRFQWKDYDVAKAGEYIYYVEYFINNESQWYSDEVSLVIEGEEDETISIYPNPATRFVQIHNAQAIEQVEVYDLMGRKVLVLDTDQLQYSSRIELDGRLSRGTYVFRMVTLQGKVIDKKIIILNN
ncbi:MAG TPA: SdrD B-like domain-containing protein [Saprospiraceae bacterium]|nr:SdrD B-like domain-containing protein [Saprospiraceae bacterium]